MVTRFGRPLYDTFFGPYTEKLWGSTWTKIPRSDWGRRANLKLLDLGDAALRLAGLRDTPIRTYGVVRYRYPRYGMQGT